MVREPVDAEKIGAVLDGTAGQERDALLARLAADEDDYDVFADTAAVLREIEEEAESVAPESTDVTPEITAEAERTVPITEVPAAPAAYKPSFAEDARAPVEAPAGPTETARASEAGGVIPLRPRRSVWTSPATRWLAAAAVLVAVAVPILRLRDGDAWRNPRVMGTLAMNGDPLPAKPLSRPWITVRGPSESGEPLRASSAKLGTLHTDLEVAANARGPRNVATVDSLAASAVQTARSIRQFSSDQVIPAYEKVRARAGAPPSQLLSTLNTARKQAETHLDPDYFALGAWTEAARFAASRRNAKFFSPQDTRRPLERAEALEGLSDEARSAVRAIRSAVGQPEGIRDWDALSDHLKIMHEGLARALDPDGADLP